MQVHDQQKEFSFKNYFVPLTTTKAITWIVIIGLIVYFNSLFNGFAADDIPYIVNNQLTHILNIGIAFGINDFNKAGQYRPIPALYFSLLYSLFSIYPFFYHLIQIILHIVCTVLIYFLFRKFLSPVITLSICLAFLVHPINVESVSYIAQTVSPLLFLFGITAVLLSASKNLSNSKIIIIFLLLLLSLLTKESGVIFLFLVPLYQFFFTMKNRLKLSIVSFCTLIAYLFIRLEIGQVDFSSRPLANIAGLSLVERLLNIPAIIFFYLHTFFFPKTLAFDQQWVISSVNFFTFYLPLIFDVAFFSSFCLFGIYMYKRQMKNFRPYLFFSFWFMFGLIPYLQIFPLDKTVAELWFYFPMVGLLGMIGIFYQVLPRKLTAYLNFVPILVIVILSLLSLRTMIRNTNWMDNLTLYTHDIVYNDNFDIENNLGIVYEDNNEYALALQHYKKSVALKPFELNLANLAITYQQTGDIRKAKQYYYQAFHVNNYDIDFPHKHNPNLDVGYATFLVFYEYSPSTLVFIQSAVSDYPNVPDLWTMLALTYYINHDKQKAIYAASKAYQLNPQNAYVYNQIQNDQPIKFNLGNKTFYINSK